MQTHLFYQKNCFVVPLISRKANYARLKFEWKNFFYVNKLTGILSLELYK